MLTLEQIKHCHQIIMDCDSVFDIPSDIEDYLGRPITLVECKQVSAYKPTDNEEQLIPNVTASTGGETVTYVPVYSSEKNVDKEKELPNVAAMSRLADQIVNTYRCKNKDYGDSFGKSVRHYGFIAALTRLSDKFNRVENFIMSGIKKGQVADESLRDTLIDMATYALMTVIALDEETSTNNGNFGC